MKTRSSKGKEKAAPASDEAFGIPGEDMYIDDTEC